LPCSLPGRYRQRLSVRCLELSSLEEILGFRRCEIAFPAPGLRTRTLWQRLPRGVRARKRTIWPCANCRVFFEQLDDSLDSSIRSTDASVPLECLAHSLSLSHTASLAKARRSLEPGFARDSAGSTEPRRCLRARHRTLRSPPSSPELTELHGAHVHTRLGFPRESTEPLAGSRSLADHESLADSPELSGSAGLRCCRRPGKLSFRVLFENTQLARQALPISPIDSHTLSGATVVNLVVDPKT
jgi:hypothetical protein